MRQRFNHSELFLFAFIFKSEEILALHGGLLKFVCFGKKIENLKISLDSSVIGSKKKYFLNQFSCGDKIVLYGDGKIFAFAEICSEGFIDHTQVWLDYDYPYRFSISRINLLSEPFPLVGSQSHTELKKKFGKGWGFKALFNPSDLPKDIQDFIVTDTWSRWMPNFRA